MLVFPFVSYTPGLGSTAHLPQTSGKGLVGVPSVDSKALAAQVPLTTTGFYSALANSGVESRLRLLIPWNATLGILPPSTGAEGPSQTHTAYPRESIISAVQLQGRLFSLERCHQLVKQTSPLLRHFPRWPRRPCFSLGTSDVQQNDRGDHVGLVAGVAQGASGCALNTGPSLVSMSLWRPLQWLPETQGDLLPRS